MKSKSLIFLLMLAAVGTMAADRLKIVATYDTYAGIARDVGGAYVEVTALANGRQDPHYVDAKPSYLVALHRADALLLNGLELEVGFLPPLLQQSGNPRIQPGTDGYVDLSRFITPIEVPRGGVDRSMGDVHPYGNPHYHLNPENMEAIATGLAEVFAAADPANSEDYQRSAGQTVEELRVLDAELRKTLAGVRSDPVVTYHSTLDYFFLHYGFTVVGFVEPKPGIKPTPVSLMGLEKTMRDRGVKILVCENYEDQKIARKVAEDTGARLVVIPSYTGGAPGADTYPDLMRTIAKLIVGGSHG
jgi:ABC-type Zn uptake system ZnuABC Zn-binding protein ZnuA